jgi:DNA-3-methyladenine glycosylase
VVAQRVPNSAGAVSLISAPRLPRKFFDRDATTVARELLGKLLVRREGRKLLAGRIVEDEAYLGPLDPAAHSYNGPTARNAVLFGPPGHAYVYFIYGNHYCTNVSCKEEGKAEGVLFRAMEPVFGVKAMAEARGLDLADQPRISQLRLVSSGPGRMSEALDITQERDNGKDLTSSRSDLWLADDGYRVERIATSKRIGIKKAIDEPLRFVIAGNPFVSGPRLP